MRTTRFDLVIYEDEFAESPRWGRDASRRAGAVALRDEVAMDSHRSLAWLTGLVRRRAGARRPAAA